MKERLLASACLFGVNCKYNGGNNLIEKAYKLKEEYEIIYICPEMDGGLPCPRVPAEISGSKVINKDGFDVTKEFVKGAKHALELCREQGITKALLKEKSPSCAKSLIYDGTFNSNLIKGEGVTAKMLRENGIEVFSENDIDKLI